MPGDSGTVIIESQARIMQSASVLRAVVEQLGLADDPEFNGQGTGFGLGALKVAVKGLLVEADGRPVDRVQAAVDQLARQVTVVRADRTYVIGVYARSNDPEKAAAIANGMVDAYLSLREGQRAAQADTASRSLEGRLEELFAKLEASEDAVERFKVENGLVGAGGSLLVEDRLAQASRDVSAAEVAVDRARAQREQLAPMRGNPERFLASTEALGSADVARLRGELERVEGLIGTLEATLGPRHPRRVEAESQRETVRRALQAEIGRLYANAVQAEERANAELSAASQALSRLTADVQQSDASRVRLRQLERDAQSGRSVYEEALLRSRETREQESVSTINVQLVSPATPAIRKSYPPSLTVLLPLAFALGAALGASVGLTAGLMAAPARPDTRRDRRASDRAATPVRSGAAALAGGERRSPAAPVPTIAAHGNGSAGAATARRDIALSGSDGKASTGVAAALPIAARQERTSEAVTSQGKLSRSAESAISDEDGAVGKPIAERGAPPQVDEPAALVAVAKPVVGKAAANEATVNEATTETSIDASATQSGSPTAVSPAAEPAHGEASAAPAAAESVSPVPAMARSTMSQPTTSGPSSSVAKPKRVGSAAPVRAASRLERDPRFAGIAARVAGQARAPRAWQREPAIARGPEGQNVGAAAAGEPPRAKPRLRLDAATVAAFTTTTPEPRP